MVKLARNLEPVPEGEGWACPLPDCARSFAKKAAAYGHIGRAHSTFYKPIVHGTVAGYLAHMRRKKKEPRHQACPGCKAAWRVYYQMRRAKKKGLI